MFIKNNRLYYTHDRLQKVVCESDKVELSCGVTVMRTATTKRLLIFISSLSSGGAERVTANLANYWAEKGWQVTVVTLSDGSDDFYALSPSVRRIALGLLHVSVHPLQGIVNNVRRVLALRRVLRQIKPDIALAMMDQANIVLALAALGLPNTVAIGSERTHPPQMPLGPLWAGLRRRAYAHLAAVTALTCESRDWLLHHTKAKKVAVIPNASPWPLPAQPPMLMPQDILPSARKILLAVGRLSEEKGFDLLIEAFAQVAPQYPDWHLVILGEGPLRLALDAQIRRAGLKTRITLAGRAGNVGHWYDAADLFVMSSRFEGFPNTLVEALAHGLPAVSFDCDTGPSDIIRHEVDGLLVPNGNVAALASALARLMGDETLRRQFAARAIDARERFSMEKIAGLWEALFDELGSERREA
jgi:glycosyltransferase involved in cell wall biosynthesis